MVGLRHRRSQGSLPTGQVVLRIDQHWRYTIKFALEQNLGGNVIQAYEPGCIQLRGKTYDRCILVGETELIDDMALQDIHSLASGNLARLVRLRPQILLVGTGETQVFPDPRIFIPLMDAAIGYEVMDTAAACRTYNVLLSEGRKVLALLFP